MCNQLSRQQQFCAAAQFDRNDAERRALASASESATNLGEVCSETVHEGLGIKSDRALALRHRVGKEFPNELRHGHTALSRHRIESNYHRAIDTYGQVAITPYGYLIVASFVLRSSAAIERIRR